MLIIADDLSGANDVACQLFLQGYGSSTVNTSVSKTLLKKLHGIPIFNTASRGLSAKKAYSVVKKVVLDSGTKRVYKKMDSTLRGNIGAEIDACIDGLGADSAALVPAYPKLKRVTINGRHFCNGKPIEKTEYAHDPVNPVKTSNILQLVSNESSNRAILIDLKLLRKGAKSVRDYIKLTTCDVPVIYIFDCEKDSDLKIIAEVVKDFKVVAGASALAGYMFKKRKSKPVKFPSAPSNTAYFIGSVKKTTHDQVKLLVKTEQLKINIIPSSKTITTGSADSIFSVKYVPHNKLNKNAKLKIEQAFSKISKSLLESKEYGRFFISGGGTAEVIFKSLGINYTEMKEVLLPGIPLTYSPERKIYIVTKPGGYGEKEALLFVVKNIKKKLL